jgi:CRP-like cAMP-binding protein
VTRGRAAVGTGRAGGDRGPGRTLTQAERAQALGSVWLFARCSKRELTRIARHTRETRADRGDRLCVEAKVGHQLYVLLDGAAQVLQRGRVVDRLGQGAVFGELALLDQRPRSATVEVTEPSRLLALDAYDVERLLRDVPTIARKLLGVLAWRLRAAEEERDALRTRRGGSRPRPDESG